MAALPPSASFMVEHDDPAMGMRKQYTVSFWESDNTLQMYDQHLKRVFLRRSVPPERPKMADFYLGGLVVVCSRPLRVLDYGDELTRRRYAAVRGTACMVIKPHSYHAAGKIINMVYDAGLSVGRLRMSRLLEEEAATFLQISAGGGSAAAQSAAATAELSCDAIFALEITGDDIMARLHELAGPADPAEARELVPASIRCARLACVCCVRAQCHPFCVYSTMPHTCAALIALDATDLLTPPLLLFCFIVWREQSNIWA